MKKLYAILTFIFALFSILLTGTVHGQTVVTYTTTGANTWVCPTGVTTITFEAYGAGGGGGGGGGSNKQGGGGGGGGGYVIHNAVTVVPGTTYNLTVGAGGTAGASGGNGGNGGFSRGTFGALVLTANGGTGGGGYSGGSGVAGTGGAATNGTTNRTGGNAAAGNGLGSGGGGGAAGSTGAGSAAVTQVGGIGGGGSAGAGANGSTANAAAGSAGNDYGGGGSGGTKSSAGGAGAQGYIVITYTPPAPANSTCATAATLPCASGTVNGTTIATPGAAHGIPTASTSNYGVWYTFVGDGNQSTISCVAGAGFDHEMTIATGACGSLTYLGSSDSGLSGGTETMSFITTAGVTYYVYIAYYGSTGTSTNTGTFTISRTCTTVTPPTNDDCTGAVSLTMNSFGSCASQSAGTVEFASGSVVPMGSCFGTPDDDVWYSFVATAGAHAISLNNITGSTTDMYFSVYGGGSCATPGTPILCSDANSSNVSGLTIGNTYYVRVYTYTNTGGQNTDFSVCVAAPPSCPANLGAGNVNIASLPYSAAGQTTAGAGDDITSSNAITCGSTSYFVDMDKVYIFTPSSSGNVTITLNSASSWTGITLYAGCPFSGSCVAYVQNSSSGAKTMCAPVVAGTTYYLVVDSYIGFSGSPSSIPSFTLDISAPSGGSPNDLPCNATTIFNGISASGDNECTSATGETMGTPTCWTSGSINSIWYKFQATSAQMYLQTTLTTIASTQIAVYSGACGSLSYYACNQDAGATGCAGSSTQNSLLDLSGLTVGSWYWVRVDGQYEDIGTFNIILNDGLSSTTNDPLLGQDCSNPVPICTNVVNVPNPSYAGTGNICDFLGTNDCTSGERNSVWYTFEIATSGNLNFTIFPNDATNNSNGAETDYDWVLWKLNNADGTVNTTCATLDAAPPVSCNFGSPGITGIAPGGNAPSPINTYFNSTFEPTLAVTAGERYVLVCQNYETTSSGFNLDFSTSSAGTIDNTPSTIYWNGAANTSFTNVANYGSCATAPACGINVVINNMGNQPLISGTTNYCRDLTINSGATLTMAASSTLYICGSLTNNGTINCPASSTIVFVDGSNTTQYISGNLAGGTTNSFGNLEVNKAAGSVICNVNINIKGNFKTHSNTSVFNSNQKYIKLAGHFDNFSGNTTFTNTGTAGTLEFFGSTQQVYKQGATQLDLNNVVVNNTGGIGNGVSLNATSPIVGTDMFIKATTGTLTLTLGTISTGGTGGTSTITGNRVHVLNTTPTSVSTGNTTSFVDGNLRRYVTVSGDYNWPVGNVTKGYQRARTVFSVTAGMTYIDSRFDLWPLTCTTNYAECGTTYDQPSENNGFWNMIPNAGTCTYDCTLYPLNATNTTGMSAWTIIKRPHTTAIDNTGWVLNGTCVASTATVVTRNAMTNFSFLGVDQALTPLPIELLSFNGYSEESYNVLKWETSSERDNDYFTIEKSFDGIHFEDLKKVDGAGNSTEKNQYETTDYAPNASGTYYRLKQTDFNGNEVQFNTIFIKNAEMVLKISEINPNPFSDFINLAIDSPVKEDVTIRIIDNSGRIVFQDTKGVNKGINNLSIDLSSVNKGAYIIELTVGDMSQKQTQKIIKL